MYDPVNIEKLIAYYVSFQEVIDESNDVLLSCSLSGGASKVPRSLENSPQQRHTIRKGFQCTSEEISSTGSINDLEKLQIPRDNKVKKTISKAQKNREYLVQWRKNKKMELNSLKTQVAELTKRNDTLTNRLNEAVTENFILKSSLQFLNQSQHN